MLLTLLTAVKRGCHGVLLALLLSGVRGRVGDAAGLAVLGRCEEVEEVDEASGAGDGEDVAGDV